LYSERFHILYGKSWTKNHTKPPGCIEESSPSGAYHADGVLDANELPIEGAVVKLRQRACSVTDLTKIIAQTMTLASDISYSFTGLKAGTYCLSIDPQEEPNFSLLRPGLWTYPVCDRGHHQHNGNLESRRE
jgi:hypothetical protein